MDRLDIWDVDELAARGLLADLGLAETPELLGQVAFHMAKHRRSMMEWAAERAQDNMVRILDNMTPPAHIHDVDGWSRGFRDAEVQVMTTPRSDLLALGPEKSRSQGQFLRTMVREARSQIPAR